MFSRQLEEAASERVQLMPGQRVQVVSPDSGEVVVEGNIEALDIDRQIVQVRSTNGTDMTVHVESDRYEIWVHQAEVTGKAPEPRAKHRNMRASKPGPYVGGRFDV